MKPITETDGATQVLKIPISKIRAFEGQPRQFYDPAALRSLADSIRDMGQLNPGSVIRLDPSINGHDFELVDGERRIRACLMAGVDFFRAEIDTSVKNKDEQFEKSVASNFNREGHPALECAHTIDRLKKMWRNDAQIWIRIGGKSSAWVSQHYSLLKLNAETLKFMDPNLPAGEQLTFSIAIQLVGVPIEYQVELARTIVRMHLGIREATHLIHKTLHSGGKSTTKGRYKQFANLLGFVTRTNTQLSLDLDMDESHLGIILRSKDLQTRMLLMERLELVISNASTLRDKVKGQLEKI